MTTAILRQPRLLIPGFAILAFLAMLVIASLVNAPQDSPTAYRLWVQIPGEQPKPTSWHEDLAKCEAARRFYLEGNKAHRAWCEAKGSTSL